MADSVMRLKNKENLKECDGQSSSSQCNVQKEGEIEVQSEIIL